MGLWQRNQLKRINVLEGSVRSGKTWVSLVLWAFWVKTMPETGLYLMAAKSLTTLKRNCLLPLQDLVGDSNFTFSAVKKEGWLFGRHIILEGANDIRSEGKIRGVTLQGAYCDELTQLPEDFFTMLLSRLSEPGAKLIATTNPDAPTHWLKVRYIDRAEELDFLDFRFLIDDNTTLPREYVENIKREYTGVFYDRFILGNWTLAEGIIYPLYKELRHAKRIRGTPLGEAQGRLVRDPGILLQRPRHRSPEDGCTIQSGSGCVDPGRSARRNHQNHNRPERGLIHCGFEAEQGPVQGAAGRQRRPRRDPGNSDSDADRAGEIQPEAEALEDGSGRIHLGRNEQRGPAGQGQRPRPGRCAIFC